jgi:Holliday junction resolvase RusA-like endonuclease
MPSKIIELALEGNVPSKKNSRVRTRSGSSIPSKAFYDWQADAIKQIRVHTRERFYNPVYIEVIVYFGTNVRADIDNRLTSILDMLVEALVIRDDKWQDVPMLAVQAQYRKGHPGAFIRITELTDA